MGQGKGQHGHSHEEQLKQDCLSLVASEAMDRKGQTQMKTRAWEGECKAQVWYSAGWEPSPVRAEDTRAVEK